ncbi:neuropeptides capa receptor-like [Amphibalanus amphitrite]|uniref:neuropeptides capa receptor-like n=1 Tax=Amphibalanus amphitrite TaxID=1232801 RepID=UPI001C9251CA|nr:neuropeptides capa receptor-like [Amphibalanus amphitrite]
MDAASASDSGGGDGGGGGWNVSTSPATVTEDAASFLRRTIGPQELPLDVVLPITVVYALIFVTGVIGNVAVCLVIFRHPALQTATNFYLFSLAVADLTVLVLGLPNDLKVYWRQYPWALGRPLCKIRALISEMTSYVSALIIVAFSLERYLAICHPLLSYTMAGRRRATRIIVGVWVLSLLAAAPFAFYTDVHYIEFPSGSGIFLETICYMPNEWPLIFSSFVFFIVPMSMLMFIYICIGIKIHRVETVGGSTLGPTGSGEARRRGNRRAVLRMLVAVVIGFFLCFAPYHAQRLLYIYGKQLPNYREINEYMYYTTGCFYYVSATINPILYNVMSAKYRRAFKETLCGRRSPLGVSTSTTVMALSRRARATSGPCAGSGSSPRALSSPSLNGTLPAGRRATLRINGVSHDVSMETRV